jgi:Tfp pilus assembly protein FimT
LLLLYYSGHGKPNKSGLLHLTTLDTVIAELETSAIPINRVYDILGTGKAKKIVILLDCCYSGAAGQGFKGAVDDQLQQLNNARGTYLVTASTELQVAHESAEEGLSLFTKHLIAGLETGEADKDGDGWVSMNELYDYVQGKVVAENPAQQPTKHVKEERGGLLIAKSGHNSREEQDEKIRNKLLDLSREDDEFVEILTEAMKLAKLETKQISLLQQQQYQLLEKLIDEKIKPVSFIRNWDKLKLPILPPFPESETVFVEEQPPIKSVEQSQIKPEKKPPKISIQETTKKDVEQEKLKLQIQDIGWSNAVIAKIMMIVGSISIFISLFVASIIVAATGLALLVIGIVKHNRAYAVDINEQSPQKITRKFSIVKLSIWISIIGILASIFIPAYQDYMTRSRWAKSIASIAALKLAISECLNDTSDNGAMCDETTSTELAKYGINELPILSDESGVPGTVSLVQNSAAIQISGNELLGHCVFEFSPIVNKNAGTITWNSLVTGVNSNATNGQTSDSCTKFVKNSVVQKKHPDNKFTE